MYCRNCKKQIPDDSVDCPCCGVKVTPCLYTSNSLTQKQEATHRLSPWFRFFSGIGMVCVLILIFMFTHARNLSKSDNSNIMEQPEDNSATSENIYQYENVDLDSSDYKENYNNDTSTEVAESGSILESTDSMGMFTMEKFRQGEWSPFGLYILYPDDSLDFYWGGDPLFKNSELMTYGTDRFPEDLLIGVQMIEENAANLENGELVLFWPYDSRVVTGLYAVEESGYTLHMHASYHGYDYDTLLYSGTGFQQWGWGKTFYPSNYLHFMTINGIAREDFTFPSTDGRTYASFPANQTYTIGIVQGTTLVEETFQSDTMFFLHADESSPFRLTPTTDGYATFDFSDTPSGEYVFTISSWDEVSKERIVYSSNIKID